MATAPLLARRFLALAVGLPAALAENGWLNYRPACSVGKDSLLLQTYVRSEVRAAETPHSFELIAPSDHSCQASGGSLIVDAGTCQAAAAEVGGMFFGVESKSRKPRGCIFNRDDSRVYFNEHPDASSEPNRRWYQVCSFGSSASPAPTAELSTTLSSTQGPTSSPSPVAKPSTTLSSTEVATSTPSPVETLVPTPTTTSGGSARFPFEAMAESCPGAVATTQCLDVAGYEEIAASVRGVLGSLDSGCDAESCQTSDVLGCWVRAVGHDFMDFDSSQNMPGGADGCIDFSDHENDGLMACIFAGDHGVSLNDVYQQFCARISLADFMVLAAEAAMDWSRTVQGLEPFGFIQGPRTETFQTLFQYGRTTASQCDGFNSAGASRMPNPERGCPETERVFGANLGLTWEESTALMGVHVMGRAEPKNSGYKGWWVDPERSRIFHNGYYRAILGKGWVPELDVLGQLGNASEFDIPAHLQGVTSKHQWQRGDDARAPLRDARHEMMLNTDLCLAYSRGPDEQGFSLEEPGEYLAQDMSRECCSWSFSPPLGTSLPEMAFCNQPRGEYSVNQVSGREEFEMCCGMAGERHDRVPGNPGLPFNCGPVGGSELAPGFSSVRRFAKDEQAWFRAFGAAWGKATSAGQSGLQPLAATCA